MKRLEPRCVGGGDIVEGDAVDEDERVVRFGAADAHLRLRALRARRRDRDAGSEPDEIGRQGRAERLDLRLVEHGDRGGRVAAATGVSEAVTTMSGLGGGGTVDGAIWSAAR